MSYGDLNRDSRQPPTQMTITITSIGNRSPARRPGGRALFGERRRDLSDATIGPHVHDDADLGNVLHQLERHPCDRVDERTFLAPRERRRTIQCLAVEISGSYIPFTGEPTKFGDDSLCRTRPRPIGAMSRSVAAQDGQCIGPPPQDVPGQPPNRWRRRLHRFRFGPIRRPTVVVGCADGPAVRVRQPKAHVVSEAVEIDIIGEPHAMRNCQRAIERLSVSTH
jgi:hypothetical protein